MKETTANLLLLICFIGIFISGCIVTSYYIINDIQICTSNPLKYQADKLAKEGNFNYSYVHFGVYEDKFSIFALKTEELDLRKSLSIPYPLS